MYIYLLNKYDWNINFDFMVVSINSKVLVKVVIVVRYMEIKGIKVLKIICRVYLILIYY